MLIAQKVAEGLVPELTFIKVGILSDDGRLNTYLLHPIVTVVVGQLIHSLGEQRPCVLQIKRCRAGGIRIQLTAPETVVEAILITAIYPELIGPLFDTDTHQFTPIVVYDLTHVTILTTAAHDHYGVGGLFGMEVVDQVGRQAAVGGYIAELIGE